MTGQEIHGFERLIVWQKSKELCVLVYSHLQANKDFGFCSQLQRASVSVMNNIAEGVGRKSRKELIRFLLISQGSCSEVKSMLYLGRDLKYFSEEEFTITMDLADEVSKMLTSFVHNLKLKSDNS